MTRHFKTTIFLGNGDISLADVTILKGVLDKAIGILGALQQPVLANSDEDARRLRRERQTMKLELQDCVDDICAALTSDVQRTRKE